MSTTGRTNKLSKQKAVNQNTPQQSLLTAKQQLKQDAMLWAEFLYSEYKRYKTSTEEVQISYDSQES